MCAAYLLHLFEVSIRPSGTSFLLKSGPTTLIPTILLQVADLHRIVVVHLDEPPQLIHSLRSTLILKTLDEHTAEAVSPRLLVRQKLESAHKILARTLRRGGSPKHLRLCWGPRCPARPCLFCSDSASCTGRRALHLPCLVETSLQSGVDGRVGTRTTI